MSLEKRVCEIADELWALGKKGGSLSGGELKAVASRIHQACTIERIAGLEALIESYKGVLAIEDSELSGEVREELMNNLELLEQIRDTALGRGR